MEIEPVVRISFNGNNQNNTNNSNNNNNNSSNINSTNKASVKKPINQKMISNINNQKSPNPLNSSVDDINNNNNNGTDEDIIKLARDLTNTFGILLGDSDQPSQFSDVIFKVGDRRFFASKIMLVARSEYFKAMFTGSMKESSIKEITLEGVDPDVFFTVLKYICIGILDLDYDHRMVSSIYQYCDLLGLQRGKELSLATMGKIAQMYLEKPDVESALLLWDSLNQSAIPVEGVHPHLRAFVLQYASISLHCDAFYSISLTTLVQMLRNDGLRMEELDILDCVIDWCRENSQQQQQQLQQSANGANGKTHSKRSSSSHMKKHDGDGGSDGSCSSRCSSRRNSLTLKDHYRQHIGNGGNYNNNDCHSDTEETFSDIDDEEHRNGGGVGDDFENDSDQDDDDDDEDDEDDDFTDDDDKDDSANDDYEYSTNKDDLDIIEDWDTTIDKNLLDEVLPLIRWENMNIGEAFERLDNLKIIPDKEISNLLRHILKSNRGESFSFLGYRYRRPRNNRKRPYPIEFLLGITQAFDSNVTNEIIPLNSFSSEFGQSTNQFLYRIKKDIKLPANLERFSFKDREFFVQLKEREKGQLAVYLAFGSKLTKPLAISVLASVIGFRFQDSIEFSFKKMFDEGFDSAWGWPKFISLDTLYKQDKYSHYSDSFCLLIELTSQWG